MLLFTIGLVLSLGTQVSFASTNFFDSGLAFSYSTPYTNSLDWQLLQELSPDSRNVLISPISLKIILGLLYQGSSYSTQNEFYSALGFETKASVRESYRQLLDSLQNPERSEYLPSIGTSIFLEENLQLKSSFSQIAKQDFKTDIRSTNFEKPEEASNSINHWINQLTHGKVKKLVSADDLRQTVMLITNVIYFKGTWVHPFSKELTFNGDFLTKPNLPPRKIQYMTTTHNFLYYEDHSLDAQIIRLEYKESSYSMFIVLPNAPGNLNRLITAINLNSISEARTKLEDKLVQLTIPKFSFTFQAKYAQILKQLGLKKIFENTDCFSEIIESSNTIRRQLIVSEVVQKTGIEVNEEGSVIYSATDVNIGNKFGENKIIFNASHPFVFFIEGVNGTILFIGKLEEPNEVDLSVLPIYSSQDDAKKTQVVNDAQNFPNSQNGFVNNAVPVNNPQQYPSNAGQEYPLNAGQKYPSNSAPQLNFNFGQRFQSTAAPQYPTPNLSPNLDPDFYQPQDVNMEDIAYRFNLFDIELLSAFSDSETNVLISPASVKTTLAMILEGAGGHCALEISEALRIPDINQIGVRNILVELLRNLNEKPSSNTFLESHNAIFTANNQRLLDSYKNTILEYYNADFKSVDFGNPEEVANLINKWAADASRQAIKEVISSQMISQDASIILSNVLYFKGQWKTAFNERGTYSRCFYSAPKNCTNVRMMHISDSFNYNYIRKLMAYVVEIPYQDKFSMLLILPSADTNVRSVIRDLPHFRLHSILQELNKSEIVLELPRFSFEYSADLVEYLKTLKIRDVFGPRANLSRIIQGNNVQVNNMVHKTKIDVDELGTVAAASTSAMIIPLMQSITVTADRPFIFLIYHQETKNIIFEGIVADPAGFQKANSGFTKTRSNTFRRS